MSGVPCKIVAVNDAFVVPIPTLMKATGFFLPGVIDAIASERREDLSLRLANATTGWNVVAIGSGGRPGLMIGVQTEQSAMWRSLGRSNSRALPISERARHNPSSAAGSRSAGVRAPRNRDGKGAWRDNVFVERLWRSVKHEEVYLRAYDSVREARASIGRYPGFYNNRHPHSGLDGVTSHQAYFNSLPLRSAALAPADAPLIDAEKLFRQSEPTHHLPTRASPAGLCEWVY
jgi:hypothetical protein